MLPQSVQPYGAQLGFVPMPCTVVNRREAKEEGKNSMIELMVPGGRLTFWCNPKEEDEARVWQSCPGIGTQVVAVLDLLPSTSASHRADTGQTYVNSHLEPRLRGFVKEVDDLNRRETTGKSK